MEHLFFKPSQNRLDEEAKRILESDELDYNWSFEPSLDENITWPVTPWLGFHHDSVPGECKCHPSRKNGVSRIRGISRRDKTKSWDPASYPMQRGWNWDSILLGSFRSSHPDLANRKLTEEEVERRVAGMLQSWVLFGFFECLLQKRIRVNYFSRQDADGKRIIDTRNVTFILWAAIKRTLLALENKSELSDLYGQIKAVLEHQKRLIARFLQINEVVRSSSSVSDGVGTLKEELYHIGPLAGRLGEITAYAFLKEPLEKMTHFSTPVVFDEMTYLARRKMKDAGFCTVFIESHRFESYTFYDWLAWWGNSSNFPKHEDHRDCDTGRCKLTQTQSSEPQHTPQCNISDCRIIRPSANEVYKILDEDKIPVLRIKPPCKGEPPRIAVFTGDHIKASYFPTDHLGRSLNTTSFVAFSHTWRHGTGSTTEQGLFCCQIEKLLATLSSYGNDTLDSGEKISYPFWIDSLCVPSSLQHRQKAIMGFSTVFRSCKNVIVLDSAIMTMKYQDFTMESAQAAILTSAWNTRLWTFMEEFIAPSLLFKMHNFGFMFRLGKFEFVSANRTGVSVPEHMALIRTQLGAMLHPQSSSLHSSNPCVAHKVTKMSLGEFEVTANCTCDSGEDSGELKRKVVVGSVDFLKSMSGRSVTHDDDEPLVLAVAFGLGTQPLLTHDGEQRMKAFYNELGNFPSPWLFLGLPVLSIPHYRWAPRSLILKRAPIQIRALATPQSHCSITPKGLLATFPVICFDKAHPALRGCDVHFV